MKNYFFVKNIPSQDGSFIPFRIVQQQPKLIIGQPVIAQPVIGQPIIAQSSQPVIAQSLIATNTFTPPVTLLPYLNAQVEIIAPEYKIKFAVPYKDLRKISDHIRKSTILNNTNPLVSHKLITPIFQYQFNTSFNVLSNILTQLNLKYDITNLTQFKTSNNDIVVPALIDALNKLKIKLTSNKK